MELAEKTWPNDWPARTLRRVREKGAGSVIEFLAGRPCTPYNNVAQELGSDVAAIQLIRLQFAEARMDHSVRSAVKDAVARLCHQHLKRGWGNGIHVESNTAGVYADLVSFLRMQEDSDKFVSKWDTVWKKIKGTPPPQGWLPSGPTDPLIEAAFEKGWPASPCPE